MTPTSTRVHAALIGLNSVHLYKQAEGAGFLDTLKGYWDSQNDATKGALIGGAGGALVGGITAPEGSALKRALLLGGLGAGVGGGIGYAGQIAKGRPAGRVDLESSRRFQPEPQNIIERGVDSVRKAGDPAAAAIANIGNESADAVRGVKSWITGNPFKPREGTAEAQAQASTAELDKNMQQAREQQASDSEKKPTTAMEVLEAAKRAMGLGKPKPASPGNMFSAELTPQAASMPNDWRNR